MHMQKEIFINKWIIAKKIGEVTIPKKITQYSQEDVMHKLKNVTNIYWIKIVTQIS